MASIYIFSWVIFICNYSLKLCYMFRTRSLSGSLCRINFYYLYHQSITFYRFIFQINVFTAKISAHPGSVSKFVYSAFFIYVYICGYIERYRERYVRSYVFLMVPLLLNSPLFVFLWCIANDRVLEWGEAYFSEILILVRLLRTGDKALNGVVIDLL